MIKVNTLEDYNQHVAIVALYLANGNKAQAKQFISAWLNKDINQRHQHFKRRPCASW